MTITEANAVNAGLGWLLGRPSPAGAWTGGGTDTLTRELAVTDSGGGGGHAA